MSLSSSSVRSILSRYAIALLLGVLPAFAPIRVFGEDTASVLALAAVLGAGWVGGFGPSAVAAIVAFTTARLVGSPLAMHASSQADIVRIGVLACTTVLICVAMGHLRRYAGEERRRRLEIERNLHWRNASDALAAALAIARTSADVTSACATELMHASGAATSAVALLASDEESLDIVQAYGYEESVSGRVSLSANPMLADALHEREVVLARSVGGSEALPLDGQPLLAHHEGFAIVPLVSSGRVLGALTLGFEHWRIFAQDEREYLAEAGQRTGRALERTRKYESAERARADGEAFRVRAEAELQERRRAEQAHRESEARYRVLAARTHRLYSLSVALSEAVTLDAVAKAVVRHGRSVVGAAAGAVALCAEGNAFETLYAEEYPPQVVEASPRFTSETGLCTTAAVSSRKPVLVGSFAEWQQQYPRSAATAADGGFTSTASLPLLVDNAPIGVLSFHFAVPINFDQEYQALLTSVAHHAAQAIDRARLYEATQRARIDAETANRAKDDFLSVVSHELRTPLNAIMGWGEMLRDGSLDGARVERATDAIVNNATRQARLIDDLLEVSRIVAGRVSLDLQELDIANIVRGAVETTLPTATQLGLEITVSQLPHARVIADPHRLEQVFGNLLSNALKFTPAGGRVTVDGMVDSGKILVRVTDTGCGIEPEVLPHIFERFRQGNNTTSRSTGGLGLGLFIVQRLVEALGGRVVAKSGGKGAGATFIVALPVAAPTAEVVQPPQKVTGVARGTTRPALAGIQVLVVDDEADAREMMSSALELSGATVITAGSAPEALARLTTPGTGIHVMLADIAMPEEDGYALIERIRTSSNEAIAHLPAAAVTACAREDERQRALAAGFQLHLAKPITPAVLVDAVARLAGMIPASA